MQLLPLMFSSGPLNCRAAQLACHRSPVPSLYHIHLCLDCIETERLRSMLVTYMVELLSDLPQLARCTTVWGASVLPPTAWAVHSATQATSSASALSMLQAWVSCSWLLLPFLHLHQQCPAPPRWVSVPQPLRLPLASAGYHALSLLAHPASAFDHMGRDACLQSVTYAMM